MPLEIKRYDSITITGHRVYPDRAALYRGLDRISARQYFLGGAQGVDNDALKYLSESQPGALKTVVVPNRVIDQPLLSRVAIEKYATRVVELRNTEPGRYAIRNRFMVDQSKKTVGFYDFRGRGGTFQTINYALNKGKLLEVNPLVEFDVGKILARSPGQQLNWIKRMKNFKTNLSGVKGIILQIMKNTFRTNVQGIAEKLGYYGVKSLEQLWGS